MDPNHHDGWDGALLACEVDAQDMEMIAEKEGFAKRTILLTKDTSFNRVVKELEHIGKNLESGDLFMLTYSGHGRQVQDLNRDEKSANYYIFGQLP